MRFFFLPQSRSWKMPGDQPVHRGNMHPFFLPPQLAAGIPIAHQHITTQCSPDQSAFPVHPTLPGLFSEGSRAQSLAKQPSGGLTQCVCCPDCGLFMGLYIKSARSSAKCSLSQGKLHLCHLFQSWFTHVKQNTCRSFPFSTSPKGSCLAHLNRHSLQEL